MATGSFTPPPYNVTYVSNNTAIWDSSIYQWSEGEAHRIHYCVRCGTSESRSPDLHNRGCQSNESMLIGIFIAPTPNCAAKSSEIKRKWKRLWRSPKVAESLAALAVRESSSLPWPEEIEKEEEELDQQWMQQMQWMQSTTPTPTPTPTITITINTPLLHPAYSRPPNKPSITQISMT